MGKKWKQWQTLLSWAPKSTVDRDCSPEIKRHLLLGRKAMTNLDSILKSRDITLPTKVFPFCQYGFSSSHVSMWERDQKEGWALKNWCFGTVVLEKTLESPLDYKEIKPVNSKGIQLWISNGRTDAEVEAPILWPSDVKSGLIGNNPDAGKDWGPEKKGATGDEIAGWHQCLKGRVWANTRRYEGPQSLACCSSWSQKESYTT